MLELKKAKKRVLLGLVFYFTYLVLPNMVAQDLPFGHLFSNLDFLDIEGKKVSLCEKDQVTVLLFFNVELVPHARLLNELNFFYQSLVGSDRKINFMAVSKGEKDRFKEVSSKNDIRFRLINDETGKLHALFNQTCGQCGKLVVIDKEQKLRYSAGYVDLSFLKQIIDRYDEKKEE